MIEQKNLDSQRDVWMQQPRESARAYRKFLAYRDMGQGRSVRNLARSQGCGTAGLWELSRRWSWDQRVRAWDAHQQAIADEAKGRALEKTIAEMNEQHARLAQTMLNRVALALLGDESRKLPPLSTAEITWGTLPRLVEIATKVQRLALGVSDRVITEHAGNLDVQVQQGHVRDDSAMHTPERMQEVVALLLELGVVHQAAEHMGISLAEMPDRDGTA